MPCSVRIVTFVGMCCVAALSTTPARSAPPQIRFDTPLVVACRDVTSSEFFATHSNARLFEAKFEISSLIAHGDEDDLIQYFYRFVSPRQAVSIIDYQPRTTLGSDYNGGIAIENKEEKSKSAGLAVTGAWDHAIKATGNGDIGSKKTFVERYELAAPMEALAASGTLLNGRGVYFKLKPSRRTTLEGSKEFCITFRAPADWRGDLLHVRCEAAGYKRGVVKQFDEQSLCGDQTFRIALHVAGDEAARRASEQFAAADARLRRVASDRREEIHRRSYPTVLRELGVLFGVAEPDLPDGWLEELLRDPGSVDESRYARLPDDVRSAVAQYHAAAKTIWALHPL